MNDYDTHKFLKLLDRHDIKYHYEGKWLVIDGDDVEGGVYLNSENLTSLPDYIKFNNDGWVDFNYNFITSLPDNIEFNNKNSVSLSLNKIISLPNDIKFNNTDEIFLYDNPLESLPDNIDEFYDRLDNKTKKYIQELFPDHWFFDKERFGL